MKTASACSASTASFSARSSTRAARITSSGGTSISPASVSSLRSFLLSGRSHTKPLLLAPLPREVGPPLFTAQDTLPYEVVSSVSGSASAIRATSSNVTMAAL